MDTIQLINCRIQYTLPSPQGVWGGTGGGIVANGDNTNDSTILVNIIGCEIVENKTISTYPAYAVSALSFGGGVTVNLINSTLGNNGSFPGSNSCAIGFSQNKSRLNVYNSILYGNWPPQIVYGRSAYPEDTCELHVYNSLIEDGQEGIVILNPNNIFYYDLSNLATDPMWDTASMYPYSLSYGSPCIDAGTLDLPPGVTLPEFDLAGNPRIYGNGIDMGAYEYGPWVGVPEPPNSKFQIPNSKLLCVNPNPFIFGTYISYELKSAGRLNISIFNSSGMLVKTLVNFNGGTEEKGEIYWDGAGPGGTALPAGIYFVRLTIDGKETVTVKVVKVENSH